MKIKDKYTKNYTPKSISSYVMLRGKITNYSFQK